jgi:acyl dehydratase
VNLPYAEVFGAAWDLGCVAVGAHAGRPQIGIVGHVEQRNVSLEPIGILETLNGGSNADENAKARALAQQHGLREVGGSDAHFVSAIGQCLTAFEEPVHSIGQLVEALRAGAFRPVTADEMREGTGARAAAGPADTSGHMQASEGVVAEELEFDRDAIGREVPGGTITITKEQILAYCKAIGDTNPLHTDEEAAKAGPYGAIIAPPTLLTTLLMGGRVDPKVTFGNIQVLGGTRIDWNAPVRAGDTIGAISSIAEVYQKTGRSGPMVFVISRTRYINQDGVEVGSMDTSLIRRQAAARTD